MSITPSDGLVGDFQWNDDLARQGFKAYAKAHDMHYVAIPLLKEGQKYNWLALTGSRSDAVQTMHYTTPYKDMDAGNFNLTDAELELKTATIQPGFEGLYPYVGVWRLP